MFENPGATIKNFAKILFVIMVIASIILAFALGLEKEYDRYYNSRTRIVLPIFLAFLIGGPISSYLSSLLVYAFGDLVENIDDLAKNVDTIRKEHNNLKKETTDTTKTEVTSVTKEDALKPVMTGTDSLNLRDFLYK